MAKLKAASEASIHSQVAQYIKMQYPGVIFRTDFAAGIKMTMGQAMKHKGLQSGRAYPDLFIAKQKKGEHPLQEKIGMAKFVIFDSTDDKYKDFAGLYLELKKSDVQLKRTKDCKKILKGESKLRKAGDWWDEHIEEQAEVLEQLRKEGYYAGFAVGFNYAKAVIDWYLKK